MAVEAPSHPRPEMDKWKVKDAAIGIDCQHHRRKPVSCATLAVGRAEESTFPGRMDDANNRALLVVVLTNGSFPAYAVIKEP